MKKHKNERLFSKYVEEWCKKIWIGWWIIDVVYYSNKEFLKNESYEVSKETVAICHTSWEYLDASIHVNSTLLKSVAEEDIENIVVHELMHILLNEMREPGIAHEERVATLLARSFILCDSKTR